MLPKVLSKSLIAASVNCIAQSQTLGAAGNLILNGTSAVAGAATLDTQRRVLITSGGNDSGITFTITGNRGSGQPINETLTGANAGAVGSVLDYLNVGNVSASGTVATTVTIGTNGTGSTDWAVPNYNITPFSLPVDHQITGTVTANFEATNDPNFWDPPKGQGAPTPKPNVTEIVQGVTSGQVVTLTAPVTGWRETITAGTGTINAQGLQAGIVNF